MISWLLLFLGIILNASAQLALKLGLGEDSQRPLIELLQSMPSILIRLPVVIGLFLYAASVVNWLLVLSRFELSVAYPLMSLGYLLTWIYGMWIFNEPYAHTRLIGIIVVIAGITLLSYPVSSNKPSVHISEASE